MTFSDFLQEIGIENIQLNSNGNFQESNIGSMGEQEVSSLCAQIAQLVNQHKTTVLKLVENLESFLTNSDPFERARGVELLVSVLSDVDAGNISNQTATVLLQFYLSRLDDQPSVADLLRGVNLLLQANLVSKTEQIEIPEKILAELNVQSHPQNTRYSVFLIFAYLLENNVEGLRKGNQSEFITKFIHCMDGEKDPRNLILLFKLARLIVLHLDFTEKVQDLFEVAFCYFPIAFRPPPEDIYRITPEDLKMGLKDLVSATPIFAIHALPVVLEKLTSTSANAKKDSMDVISACLPTYTIQPFIPHIPEIWSCLKTCVALNAEDATELAALTCIRDITKAFSKAIMLSNSSQPPLEKFLVDVVISECTKNLQEDDLKFAKPSGKILVSAASASLEAAFIVVNNTFPLLISLYDTNESISKKQTLLKVLTDLMVAARVVHATQESKPSPLAEFKGKLIEIFASVLVDTNHGPLEKTAVNGLYQLIASHSLLSDVESDMALNHICLKSMTKGSQSSEEALTCLSNLSKEKSSLVVSFCVPFFLNALKNGTGDKELIFKSFQKISVCEHVFSQVCLVLFEYLHTSDNCSKILNCLLQSMKHVESLEKSTRSEVREYIIQILKSDLLDAICNDESSRLAFSLILDQVIRRQSVHEQQDFMNQVLSIFKVVVPQTEPQLLLFRALIFNARSLDNMGVSDWHPFVIDLISFWLHYDQKSNLSMTLCAQIVACVINKLDNSNSLLIANEIETKFMHEIGNSSNSYTLQDRIDLVLLYAWVSKGFVVKSNQKGLEMTRFLISLLENDQLGSYAANGIEIIAKDDENGVLTKLSFATQKVLYKQKLYNYCVPVLLKGFEYADAEKQNVYLLSLSHFLRNVPKKTLVNELEKLFPMLLKSLQSTDSPLKQATLDTFSLMVHESPSIITQHIFTVINCLISLFAPSNSNSALTGNDPHVRVKALHLMGTLPGKIEFSVLVPYKKIVLDSLLKSLDDHKRVVRREAANTRGKWFLLLTQTDE